MTTFLVQLEGLVVDRIDMDEAMASLAISKVVLAEYSRLEIDAPDWLKAKNEELSHQVNLHLRDFIMRSARQAAMEVDSLKTREERRGDALANKAKWEEKLRKLNNTGSV